MKKILMLTIAFMAIALLPQSVMAQEEVKTTEKKEVKTTGKKALKGNVVPLRNPNAKQSKAATENGKEVRRVPFTRSKKAMEADKAKGKEAKKIELLVRPLDKKDEKQKKSGKQMKKKAAAKIENQ